MSRIQQGAAGLLTEKIFTISSDWELIKQVATQVREAARRYRRDRFFVLDQVVRKKLADPATCDREVWALLDDTDMYETGAFQGLLKKSLNDIEAGRSPSELAALLQEQIKHRVISSPVLASGRAPTLSYTLRMRWVPTTQRPKNPRSWLLLDFCQYAPVSEQDLQRTMQIPAYPSTEGRMTWEELRDAESRWEATYGQVTREGTELRHRLDTPLKKITIAVWLDHTQIPQMRFRKVPEGKTLAERRQEFWKHDRDVRKKRLDTGNDSHHWKWLCVGPESPFEDVIFLLVLYLTQEGMVKLTPEISQSLQQYFLQFSRARQLGGAELLDEERQHYVLEGGGIPFEHMLRHFVLPEDWRTLRKYIRKMLWGMWLNEQRAEHATNVHNDGDISHVTVEEAGEILQVESRGQKRAWSPLGIGEGQGYGVDEMVRILEGETEEGLWTPRRNTVFDWIKKRHRWHGKICVISQGQKRKWLRVTQEGLEQIRMIVRDENRYRQLWEEGKSRGMTPDALKKLFQRKKTPDGMPDWDAIKTHIENRSKETETTASSEDVMSLEERITFFEAQLAEAEPGSDAWIHAHDTLQRLYQMRQGSES